MKKSTINNKILEDVELFAEDNYTLDELFDELKISSKLKKDEQILKAFEQGLVNHFIYMTSQEVSDDELIENSLITNTQCKLWHEKYATEINEQKQKIKDEKKLATHQFSNVMCSGMQNILKQNAKDYDEISQQVLYEDITAIVKRIKNGEKDDLLTILTTNLLQMQVFNGTVTQNLMGNLGSQLNGFEKLSSIQMKLMQETRKNILAINEITNPKKTTFVKEANQYNHLHQNSHKKIENENELQNEIKLIDGQDCTDIGLSMHHTKAMHE